MTSFDIKLLAIGLMTIDHVGLLFFPEYGWMRVVGRLAFPLFAWQIALGAMHTKHGQTYLIRLLIFGVISQPIFSWFVTLAGGNAWSLNIFFTLATGLAVILACRQWLGWWTRILSVALAIGVATILPMDYGAAGVLSIVAFSLTLSDCRLMLIGQSIVFMLYSAWVWWQGWSFGLSITALSQPIAPLATLILAAYNGEQGHRAKYLFYAFYPVHLLVLCLIWVWLN